MSHVISARSATSWGRLSYLFLLFFGTLHSDAYIFPFLLCFSLLFFSQLFVRPPQTAILLFCISFLGGGLDPCLLYNVTLQTDITRWSILKSDWLYSLQPKMEKLCTVSRNKTRSWLWLRSWTPYCQIQKLKKVGKITRPFRYDLNQIPYNYTVEVRNRFKGLDLIECLMNYGWKFMTLYRRQGSRPSPK